MTETRQPGTRPGSGAGESVRDVVIVGAGHNALVAACYLARGGLDVEVVERRDVVGGAVSTVERFDGYQMDVGSSAHIMVRHTGIVEDLDLAEVGLEYQDLDPWGFAPFGDEAIAFHVDLDATCESIAAVCGDRDAEAYRRSSPTGAPATSASSTRSRTPDRREPRPAPVGVGAATGLRRHGAVAAVPHLRRRACSTSTSPTSASRPRWRGSARSRAADPRGRHRRPRRLERDAAPAPARPPEGRVGDAVGRARASGSRRSAGRCASATAPRASSPATARARRRDRVRRAHRRTRGRGRLPRADDRRPRRRRHPAPGGRGRARRAGARTIRVATASAWSCGWRTSACRATRLHRRRGVAGAAAARADRAFLRAAHGDFVAGAPRAAGGARDDVLGLRRHDRAAGQAQRDRLGAVAPLRAVERRGLGRHRRARGHEARRRRRRRRTRASPTPSSTCTCRPRSTSSASSACAGQVMHVEMGLDQMFAWRPAAGAVRLPDAAAGLYLTGASTHPGGGVFGASGRSAARVVLADRTRGDALAAALGRLPR
jgi:hypothetical protein